MEAKKKEDERKKEEAKAKRDEIEKKKKEDLRLKEEAKKKPTTAPLKNAGPKKTGKDDDDQDDPIARSLKERIQAGGLTEVVASKGKSGSMIGSGTDRRPSINTKPQEGPKPVVNGS